MKNNLKTLLRILSSILIFTVMLTGISIYNFTGGSPVKEVYAKDNSLSKIGADKRDVFKNPFAGLHSALLGNPDTGEIYFADSIDDAVPMASLTKLMTYLIVKEAIDRGDIKAGDKVKISKEAEDVTYLYGKIWLKEGQRVPLKDLMKAMIVVSSNESAVALACHVAGSESAFTDLMNKRAKELGLESAVFLNSSGLPKDEAVSEGVEALQNPVATDEAKKEDINSQNRMSARDLFVLGSYILRKYPEITKLSSVKKISLDQFSYEDENTNSLLKKFKSVDGLKTGYTDAAGRCIMTSQTENFKGEKKRVIGIVLGADTVKERNKDAEILYHMGKENLESSFLYNTHALFRVSIPDKNSMTKAPEEKESKGFIEKFKDQKFIFKVVELGAFGILVLIIIITIIIRAFKRKKRRYRNIMGGGRRNKRRRIMW